MKEALEPAAHMFPCDLERFKDAETSAEAYSVEVGHPEKGKSVPLYPRAALSPWVSVKERLPNERQIVLLGFFEGGRSGWDGDSADCLYQIGTIRPKCLDEGVHATLLAGGPSNHLVALHVDDQPTHWMPLPNPPEADNA